MLLRFSHSSFLCCLLLMTCLQTVSSAFAVTIVLLGDSTTQGSVPRIHNKQGPHLEEVIASLLVAEGVASQPPVVLNLGQGGDFLRRLLDTRYSSQVASLTAPDYIFIRYGLNDESKRENFAVNFPADYHELLGRLRQDHPKALLIPTTVIPYLGEERDHKVNDIIRQVAQEEKLTLFDLYPLYALELQKQGQHALNYRRFPLKNLPVKYHEFAKPFLQGDPPKVEVMDNQLDVHFGHLPGWYGDRHPNLAGYHVIGRATASFLVPLLREPQAQR
jgi:lysophospholipase L1-like esterase